MKNTKNIEVKKGSKKTKFYVLVLLIGLALTGWSLFGKDTEGWKLNFKGDPTEDIVEEKQIVEEENSSNVGAITYFEGTLNNSDDKTRGNYKLVSNIGDIYIRTTRDFSAMIGLSVLVRIVGTLDKFELVDIQPKIAKDGFISQ